jgi:hypothetical protein
MGDEGTWYSIPPGNTAAEIFPRLAGRRYDSGSLLGDSSAGPCHPPTVDTASWTRRSCPVPSSRVSGVTLLLPPVFRPAHLQLESEPTPVLGHILGSWHMEEIGGPPVRSVTIWLETHPGYPSIAAPVGTQQRAFFECRIDIASRSGYLSSFVLDVPHAGPRQYLAAYWPARDGVWLAAQCSSPERSEEPSMRAMILSVSY